MEDAGVKIMDKENILNEVASMHELREFGGESVKIEEGVFRL